MNPTRIDEIADFKNLEGYATPSDDKTYIYKI